MRVEQIVKETSFSSARELFDYLMYGPFRQEYGSAQFLFRGLASDSYDLIPNSLRESNTISIRDASNSNSNTKISGSNLSVRNQVYIEYTLLRSFYQYCNELGYALPNIRFFNDVAFDSNHFLPQGIDKWLPESLYDLTALAQHYGVTTRLLDWSTDFLTSLHFACQIEHANPPAHVTLWMLNPYILRMFSREMENFPLKFIFPNYHNNKNITAQRGLFTMWEIDITGDLELHLDRRPLDILLTEELPKLKDFSSLHDGFIILQKIIIPTHIIDDIKNILAIFNYNEAKIFPGYRGVADWIMNENNPKPLPVSIGFPSDQARFYK